MKKIMMILVMLLIAATSYNQTSRKPANSKEPAEKPAARPAQTTSSRSSVSSPQDRSTTSRSTAGSTQDRTTTSRRTDQSTTTQSTTSRQTAGGRQETVSSPAGQQPSRRADNIPTNRTTRRSSEVGTNRSSSHSSHSHTPAPVDRPRIEYTSPRVYRDRHVVRHNYSTPPRNIEYRRVHHVYRRPVHLDIYWTPVMHRHYIDIYPMVPHWRYHNGYRIEMISAYDAMYYHGEVVTVYGRVTDVYYSPATDELFLYFGPYYPYQDFTVVIPGYLARNYGRNPERYFMNRDVAVTGLITSYDGEPEIYVKRDFQLHLY